MTRRSSGTDLIRGEQRFDPKLLSDPVVRREDGSWLYLLPSVIDDVDLGVTHVVRGEDHVSNSAAQIADVRSARRQAARVRARSAAGRRRRQIVEAARLLWRRASARRGRRADGAACRCWRGSARRSRSSRSRRSTSSRRPSTSSTSAGRPRISIRTRSSWSMPGCSISSIMPRSPIGCRTPRPRQDWLLLRGNLERLARFRRLVRCACTARSSRPSSATTNGCWSRTPPRSPSSSTGRPSRGARSPASSRQSSGKKGRELFHPLRLALTGRDSGPEMAGLSPRWARTRAVRRLEAAARALAGLADGRRRRPYLCAHVLVPAAVEPPRGIPRSRRLHAPPRAASSVIGAASRSWSRSIIVIEFLVDAKIGTAPPPQVVEVELYPRQPHRRRDHRRPEEGPGGAGGGAEGTAAAVPEAREAARD